MVAFSAVWSRKFSQFGKLNSAYITLIPKKKGAEEVKDFRPICLVHSFAKLLTKVLANRVFTKLQDLVSPRLVPSCCVSSLTIPPKVFLLGGPSVQKHAPNIAQPNSFRLKIPSPPSSSGRQSLPHATTQYPL